MRPTPTAAPAAPASRASVTALRDAGRLDEAIAAQLALINAEVRDQGRPSARETHALAVLMFMRQDFASAVQVFAQTRALDPTWPDLAQNLGMSLLLAGRPEAALAELQAASAQARRPSPALHDALAHALGTLGRTAEARAHGERSLSLKDALAGPTPATPSRWPAGQALPPVDPRRPARQVIAFSLFGDRPRYLDGALANARLAARLYPGWTCRFYLDDSVPEACRQALQAAGAQLRLRARPQRPADALFWRFLVAEDPQVGRFLVRDADSVINPREAAAVAEWLASDQPFHLMRDHAAHTDLMLAGLWGGVAGWLPPLAELLQGFVYRPGAESRSADQLFLGQRVWPRIRAHCRIHDALYRLFGATDFPAGATLPAGRHVGDNAHAYPHAHPHAHVHTP